MKLPFNKLTQTGVAHLVMPAFFIIAIGAIGIYVLNTSHAATPTTTKTWSTASTWESGSLSNTMVLGNVVTLRTTGTIVSTVATTVSPSGAIVLNNSSGSIINSFNNKFTVTGGVVYKNGLKAGYSANVTEIAYVNKVIWSENTAGRWWSWTSKGWTLGTNPLSYESSGTIILTLNAGAVATWDTLTRQATMPSGTTIALAVRTSSNDTTWSAWTGSITSATASQYIQVRVTLSTTNTAVTPTLSSLSLGYTRAAESGAPVPAKTSGISCDYRDNTWDPGDATTVGYTITDLSSKNGNPASFSVKLNAHSGTTQVVAYPDVQCILTALIPATLTSSFNITPPATSTGLDYEFAYDFWINTAAAMSSSNPWANNQEIMIWTYNNGQTPAGSVEATLSDGSKVWGEGSTTNGSGPVSVVLPKNETSGTVNLVSILSQLRSKNLINSADTGIDDVEYGIEAPDGGNQTFTVNSFSVSE